MATSQLRTALREKFGTRCYRITRNGEVHIHGRMPNSVQNGWWFASWASDKSLPDHLGLTVGGQA